jgi:hypothetical protein
VTPENEGELVKLIIPVLAIVAGLVAGPAACGAPAPHTNEPGVVPVQPGDRVFIFQADSTALDGSYSSGIRIVVFLDVYAGVKSPESRPAGRRLPVNYFAYAQPFHYEIAAPRDFRGSMHIEFIVQMLSGNVDDLMTVPGEVPKGSTLSCTVSEKGKNVPVTTRGFKATVDGAHRGVTCSTTVFL